MIEEHSFPVDQNVYYDVFTPPSPRALLVALHGYGGNKDSMLALARRISETAFTIASLQGLHQHIVPPKTGCGPLGYGCGWLTNFHPEDSIALHHRAVTRIIDGHANGMPVFLLGFSQSVALNFRYAFTFPEQVAGVIGICGGIPGDWQDDKCRSGTVRILYLTTAADPHYPPETAKRNADALAARAAGVTHRTFPGQHRLQPAMLPVIRDWILKPEST